MNPDLIVGMKDGMLYATPINDKVKGSYKIDGDLILGVMKVDPTVKDELENTGDDTNLHITGEKRD